MGKISSIEYVQQTYLTQFLKGEYKVVENHASSTQSKPPFENLFEVAVEYDLIVEVDKSIVCQWLKEKSDNRFEYFIEYYFVPNNTINLSAFSYENVFSLISPHNTVNSNIFEKLFNYN
jgi:hypothetical protein